MKHVALSSGHEPLHNLSSPHCEGRTVFKSLDLTNLPSNVVTPIANVACTRSRPHGQSLQLVEKPDNKSKNIQGVQDTLGRAVCALPGREIGVVGWMNKGKGLFNKRQLQMHRFVHNGFDDT